MANTFYCLSRLQYTKMLNSVIQAIQLNLLINLNRKHMARFDNEHNLSKMDANPHRMKGRKEPHRANVLKSETEVEFKRPSKSFIKL